MYITWLYANNLPFLRPTDDVLRKLARPRPYFNDAAASRDGEVLQQLFYGWRLMFWPCSIVIGGFRPKANFGTDMDRHCSSETPWSVLGKFVV
jgi:hypothetical protein